MTASCIYDGTIRHRRVQPRREFRHSLALWYVDLDELPELLGGRLLRPSPGALRFRRGDYHGDPQAPLAEAVRDTVAAHTGSRPLGPVRLLTHLRSFGHCFNPVSFYFCLSAGADRVQAILAEVTNTPWGERHAYVLRADDGAVHERVDKAFHVSPFMAMDHEYELWLTAPDTKLDVGIVSRRDGEVEFDAKLALERRPLHARALAHVPLPTLAVAGRIYANALRLKLKGAPYHAHPAR